MDFVHINGEDYENRNFYRLYVSYADRTKP